MTLLLLVCVGVSSVFLGCKRSITSNNTFYMKAKINNKEYSDPNCMATLTDHTLVIEGLSNASSPFPNYPFIAIAIPVWFGAPGAYPLDSVLGNSNLRYFLGPDRNSNYKISMYGEVFINSISDEVISGTFHCTTKDTTEVTEGAFTAKVFK